MFPKIKGAVLKIIVQSMFTEVAVVNFHAFKNKRIKL